MSESTIVIEREPLATQPEADPSDSPEPSTEAEEAPEAEEVDADLSVYLKEQGLEATPADKGTKDATLGTKPEDRDPVVEERAQELLRDVVSKATRANQELGVTNAFRNRADLMRQYLAPVISGERQLTEMDTERLIATFNEHHAQSGPIHAATFLDGLYGAAEEMFPGMIKSREDHKSTKDFLTDLVTRATTKGYVSESDSKKAVRQALIDHQKHLESNPDALRAMLSKVTAPGANSHSAATGGGRLTAAAYAKKLASGEPIEASEVDAMTARFLSGG